MKTIDDQIVAYLKRRKSPATAREVSDKLGTKLPTTRVRLCTLNKTGVVQGRQTPVPNGKLRGRGRPEFGYIVVR